MTIEQISKLDVACRQLDTAIELWFQESDPVSIHTLAASAHQIVHDIIRHRGGRDPLFNSPYIKPGFEPIAKKHYHQHYNFFKHADRAPEASIDFDSSLSQYFIVFSLVGLEQLGIKRNLFRSIFSLYFGFHNPHLFDHTFFTNLYEEFHVDVPPELNLTRHEFFHKCQQALSATMR